MRFLHPEMGWWALAILAAIVLLKWRVRWRFAAFVSILPKGRLPRRAAALRRAPFAILALAAALTGLALMDPVIPYSQADIQSRGLDIVVLLDLSSSMQEEMGSSVVSHMPPGAPPRPTRLDAVKEAVRRFIRARRDDRIGLVVFSDNPYVISPLTFDHEYLLHYVDMVDDKILAGEGQTAIGDGLALSDYVLYRQSTPNSHGHQVIVLFTDGENNRGREPVDVLKETRAADIRVHMVGVDLESQVKEKPAVQELLRGIQDSGGRYFDATSERSLLAAEHEIDSIEKGLLTSRVYVRDVPVYQWFTIPALIVLAAAVALRAIPFFADQT